MPENPYRKTSRVLGALLDAPVLDAHSTPYAFSNAVGMPSTSGYRALGQIEAPGLVSRGSDGIYLRGAEAYRIGLAAHGLGKLSSVCGPVLLRLRQSTQRTAIIGLIHQMTLTVGPFSMARGHLFMEPPRQAEIHNAAIGSMEGPFMTNLATIGAPAARSTLFAEVVAESDQGVRAIAGILTEPGDLPHKDRVEREITIACERFKDALSSTVSRNSTE